MNKKNLEIINVQFVKDMSINSGMDGYIDLQNTKFSRWTIEEMKDGLFITTDKNRLYKVPATSVLRIEYKLSPETAE